LSHRETLIASVICWLQWIVINSLSLSHNSRLVVSYFHLITMIRHERWKWEKRAMREWKSSGARGTGSRLTEWRRPDRSRCDSSKNKGLTTVGLLHGRGTVCPIRSDRYSTPPYNLHGLMTSITLLRASAARFGPLASSTRLATVLDTRLRWVPTLSQARPCRTYPRNT